MLDSSLNNLTTLLFKFLFCYCRISITCSQISKVDYQLLLRPYIIFVSCKSTISWFFEVRLHGSLTIIKLDILVNDIIKCSRVQWRGLAMPWANSLIVWVRQSERLLLNTSSAIFQLYHGENKLIFNEMMKRSTLY